MQKHHEAALSHALDRLGINDVVTIFWDDVYNMFNCERVAKTPYREIQRRWEELCKETWKYSTAPKLWIIEASDSVLAIYREPFKEENESAYPLESKL